MTPGGTGGCGKTRLAYQVAADLVRNHPEGSWLVELAPLSDPALVAQTAAFTLGLHDVPGEPILVTLQRYPQARRVLLILDNSEHPLDACARAVAFASALARVCRRLDGIPLAIELAAVRVRGLSVEKIASHLHDRFRLLTGGSRTALRRQQTLRATIDWSHDLLTEPERVLFRRLAVFAGGWSLEAVESVGQGEVVATIDQADVLDLLLRLVGRSLVVAEESSGEQRYILPETIRQYATEKLVESGEMAAARRRHRDHYLAFAESALPGLERADLAPWLALLEREHDNIRAALDWSRGEPDGAAYELRLARPLGALWFNRGHLEEARARLTSILPRGSGLLPDVRAGVLHWAGQLEGLLGDQLRARELYEESLGLARLVGDKALIAGALRDLAWVTIDIGYFDEARAFLEEALPVARASGDQSMTSNILENLGQLLHQQGDDTAKAAYEEAAALARSARNPWLYGMALIGLGTLAIDTQDDSRARILLDEASKAWSDRSALIGTLFLPIAQGDLARAEGDLGAAWEFYRQAVVEARDSVAKTWLAGVLGRVAGLSVAEGHKLRAIRLFGALAAWYASVGMLVPWQPHHDQERDQGAAREALGEEAFARAWADGHAMTLEQAVEYALQDEAEMQEIAVSGSLPALIPKRTATRDLRS